MWLRVPGEYVTKIDEIPDATDSNCEVPDEKPQSEHGTSVTELAVARTLLFTMCRVRIMA